MPGTTELLLVQLHAPKGLKLANASTLLIALEERGELHIQASEGEGRPRLRIAPVSGSALGALHRSGSHSSSTGREARKPHGFTSWAFKRVRSWLSRSRSAYAEMGS